MDTVARTEMVGAELSRMIERRDEKRRQSEGERREEELWVQTVKRFNERSHQGMLFERLRFHEAMIRAASKNAEVIVERHRAEVERCAELLGISTTEGEAA